MAFTSPGCIPRLILRIEVKPRLWACLEFRAFLKLKLPDNSLRQRPAPEDGILSLVVIRVEKRERHIGKNQDIGALSLDG